jgi:membrane-bound lytic murein transglycosylase D
MRIIAVILLFISVFTSATAQISPKNQASTKEKLDSINEFYEDYKNLQHFGPFVDFIPEVEDSVIIKRIQSIESDIPLRFDKNIRGFIDYFSVRNRDYTRKMIKRSQVYFPIIEPILAKYNMPQSLKYLAIVESGLDPTIKSWAGALGMWQFMPATGKSYSLDYDAYIDERQNPYKSTEAACKYLKSLYNSFGDWELALGAYNCGPGNMRKAIRSSGGKTTFSEVYNYLPKETRSYVPQFMAVNYVMRFASEHNLYVEEWESNYLPEADTIILNQYIDLNKLCSLTGVCSEHFLLLNPEIKKSTVSEAWSNYPLIIPRELSRLGKDSLRSLLSQAAIKDSDADNEIVKEDNSTTTKSSYELTKKKHIVKRGESLGSIATKQNVSVSDLKKWNGLKGSTIYPGQTLTIYSKSLVTKKVTTTTTTTTTTSTATFDNSTYKENGKTYYTVKSGDALSAIADKNNVAMSQIQKWNNMSSTSINTGQKLIVGQEENTTEVSEKQESVKKELVYTYYTVRSGDALGVIANKNNTTVTQIKTWNNLKSNSIQVGQKLIVGADEKKVEQKLNKVEAVSPKTVQEGVNTIYTVKSGDALGLIANDFGITLDQLKSWNDLTSNSINVGQKLIVKKTILEEKKTNSSSTTKSDYYIVKSGDGLGEIAINNGMSVEELKTINGLTSNTIQVGQKLLLKKTVTNTQLTDTKVSSTNIKPTVLHTVTSGESLYVIAAKYGMTINELKALNDLSSESINVGQKLKVFAKDSKTETKVVESKTHIVKSGESLWAISQKYNVSIDDLKLINKLTNVELKVGQVIKLN